MLAIQLTINVILLAFIVALAAFLGFIFRSQQIGSLRRKVINLENEMLSNHSEILDLQRENASLEQQLHIPVISMKTTREEKSTDLQDSQAKKLGGRKDKI